MILNNSIRVTEQNVDKTKGISIKSGFAQFRKLKNQSKIDAKKSRKNYEKKH